MERKMRKRPRGLCLETAIVVEKDNEDEGVDFEYDYIEEKYPGYTPIAQQLRFIGEQTYDIITIRKNHRTLKVYFLIDNYFGKWKDPRAIKSKLFKKKTPNT